MVYKPAKKKRRVHNALEDANEGLPDIGTSHSRQIRVAANRRTYIRTPRSPTASKRKPPCLPIVETWSPNVDVEDWDWEDVEQLVDEDICVIGGRTRSQASSNPFLEWLPFKEEFLLEFMRAEGRTPEGRKGVCVTCRDKERERQAHTNSESEDTGSPMDHGPRETGSLPELATDETQVDTPNYRCRDCFGGVNECLQCCLARHRHLPFHSIQEWNGKCFKKTSLMKMGMRIQLGHGTGECTNPEPAPKMFAVLHTNGVHSVAVDYCDCEIRVPRRIQILQASWYPATVHYPATCATFELLKHFHGLSLCSKVSAHEYYNNLERLTDNSRVDVPKTRYRAFLRMMRQFRHLRMLKRYGRGNLENGISTTGQGDLALTCAACPQPGVNLPANWQTVSQSSSFLYSLFVAIDANFRLKNRLRVQETPDPGLHTGLAYFVQQEPYEEHVLKFASQADISSCSGFNALARADSKATNGLRYTGVGMCICARHELIRPGGVGDLQKGERYCNMDFILLSAISQLALLSLTIIYDIACQWKVNFPSRMQELPSSLRISTDVTVSYAIPKCHLHAHQAPCQTPHSLNLQPGVGRTDGEGIERDWSLINPAENSTKEMGAGSRHDTLDDLFSHHNWLKTTGLGLSLRRKYLIAVVEAKRHKELFEEFSASVNHTNLVATWTEMIVDWEKDKTKPNPYVSAATYADEASVKLKLIEAEREEEMFGSGQSATGFLSTAFAIEESQRRLSLQHSETEMSALQASQLQEKRTALRKQLKKFRAVQKEYMPALETLLRRDGNTPTTDIEETKLWLPSDLSDSERDSFCSASLSAKEEQLRDAQCRDALERIRLTQRAKRHVVIHKKKSQPGQRTGTRARAEFDRLDVKIAQAVAKYRAAHAALISLRGRDAVLEELPELRKQDICPPPAFDIDGKTPARTLKEASQRLGEGRREVSWIWRTAGVIGDGDDVALNEGLRIEWAKGRARALRWSEEVLLCKEEMRRVRQTLTFRSQQWQERASPWAAISNDESLSEGISAYAHSQTMVQDTLLSHFERIWQSKPSKRSQGALLAPSSVDATLAENEALMSDLLNRDPAADGDEEGEEESSPGGHGEEENDGSDGSDTDDD